MLNLNQVQVNLVFGVIDTNPKSFSQITRLVNLSPDTIKNALAYLESIGVVYKVFHKQDYHYISEAKRG